MNNEYEKKLEEIIKTMLRPLKNIPLKLVIEGMSDNKIIPFNKTSQDDLEILKRLELTAINVCKNVNKVGIKRTRPNEVGNDIENYVKKELNNFDYSTDTPKAQSGKKKSTGYPDLEFTDHLGNTNYLECKTFNIKNISTTQRSFYLSPSEDFKITEDAHHFIISFEIYEFKKDEKDNVYKTNGWKILSIENLDVDVKYEFNSDNKRVYNQTNILAEGKI